MSDRESLEWDAEHQRQTELLDGLLNATVDMDCDVCGLNIHVGDPIALGRNQWVHPICAVEYEQELAAERRHDADRERGI